MPWSISHIAALFSAYQAHNPAGYPYFTQVTYNLILSHIIVACGAELTSDTTLHLNVVVLVFVIDRFPQAKLIPPRSSLVVSCSLSPNTGAVCGDNGAELSVQRKCSH